MSRSSTNHARVRSQSSLLHRSARVGPADTAWIEPPFFCDYGFNIELGERVYFNFNCVVLDVCAVRIGSFTMFGPAVQIYTPMHPLDAELRRRQEYGKPVEIGSHVWVGGGAAGNPCRVIRPVD